MEHSAPRAWAEIDTAALQHNFRFAREQSGCENVMAVVKANAYGHGVQNVITALEVLNPTFYGVANVAEAREVNAFLPNARIYILGAANPTEYREIVESGYTACASNLKELEIYGALAQSAQIVLKIHLALDTGMGRGGFLPEGEFSAALRFSHPNLEIEGIGSHLPVADEDEEFTIAQFKEFEKHAPASLKYRHLANSAGILHYRSESCNLIRPGLMLYGSSPLPEYQSQLRPVMRLFSRISLLRDVPAGKGISYGRTFITVRDSKVAVIGVGYADGVKRSLSGKEAHVYINGEHAPIIGRITMDQIMVDVTDLKQVETGDLVEIFGENILVHEIADKADTISWEVFTGIAPRVKRVLL